MKSLTKFTVPALRVLLAADKDGGAGAGGKTLETQLADATAENKKLVGQVDALTRERDEAKAEVTKLEGQFNAAAKEATDAKAESKRLADELTGVKADRDEKATKLATAEANVGRLEKLCGVKGVNKNATVPAAEESGAKGHVLDQYIAATGAEKRALYSKHKTEIRAEARRRVEAAQ